MARTPHFSKPALDALLQMCPSSSTTRPLKGVLWDLEFADRLTISQILLRRELRRMTPDERRSLICEIVGSLRSGTGAGFGKNGAEPEHR